MSKLNIFVDIENITIDGDNIKYNYSQEDIDYMLAELTTIKAKKNKMKDVLTSKTTALIEEITEIDNNIAKLEQVKAMIEGS